MNFLILIAFLSTFACGLASAAFSIEAVYRRSERGFDPRPRWIASGIFAAAGLWMAITTALFSSP